MKYIICEVMYGGHITDKWDRRVCAAYLEEIMKPEIFSGMALAPGFIAPPPDEEYEFGVRRVHDRNFLRDVHERCCIELALSHDIIYKGIILLQ